MNNVLHVSSDTAPLFAQATGRKFKHELLWGDRVQVLDRSTQRWRVHARNMTGYVDASALGGESLLEVYVIDVGQGDAVLIRFPDDRHVLIDGGYTRTKLPTNRSAADFVDWKFAKDYGRSTIRLDAIINSHCDADHYGGLWDLLDASRKSELDAARTEVGAFYHAGVSWWIDDGKRNLGPVEHGFLTRLLGNAASVRTGLSAGARKRLQGEWADFLRCMLASGCDIQRLSNRSRYVPGFEPSHGGAALRVLAPIEPEAGRLYDFGSDSQNTNGNSIALRLDYGRVRVLLSGDLNRASQRKLLAAYAGHLDELACDVAKGCHHGSEDVSYEFLKALEPGATVISSGDVEAYAHPRPSIVAASALAGHVQVKDDTLLTPLVFSTEIARGVRLGRFDYLDAAESVLPHGRLDEDDSATVHYKELTPGALHEESGKRPLAGTYVVTGLVYGLVNVRTDGERILCATLNEKDSTWDCQSFESRFATV